ncbi:CsgG/HfaB family protein [Fontimonas sp. SYSU GA230001]|uniref:CsgG/HfaB family protein n=1 Tax=Fontimonas sp. SYSU GA230001 TaxID=3142450 RepID=UPI0032B602AD
MRTALLLAAALLAACAPTAQVSRGGGAGIEAARSLDAQARPRITVAAIVDRTGRKDSLAKAVEIANRRLPAEAVLTPQALLSGLRDLLTTELFVTDRFIVLERAALEDVLAEQVFEARTGETAALPSATLEGADLIVVGAITAIDPGADGGALPIPVPLGRDNGFGILNVRAARGYIAMDLRVIDARTARVVNATSVEGRNWRYGVDFTGFFAVGHDLIKVPGILRAFGNTPLEGALQEMVTAAVARIGEASARPAQAGSTLGVEPPDKQ